MAQNTEMVTVFRSADLTADDDAQALVDSLVEAGLHPLLANDDTPGVVSGTVEVRVPRAEQSDAEMIVAARTSHVAQEVDSSHALDLETVFSAEGITAEMEATTIKAVLEQEGIEAILVGSSTLPNLPFQVQVASELAPRATEVIREAQAAGPAAADELERLSEHGQ